MGSRSDDFEQGDAAGARGLRLGKAAVVMEGRDRPSSPSPEEQLRAILDGTQNAVAILENDRPRSRRARAVG